LKKQNGGTFCKYKRVYNSLTVLKTKAENENTQKALTRNFSLNFQYFELEQLFVEESRTC
jgi:hypothetical protein